MEFVKVVGGVEVVPWPHGMWGGHAYFLTLTVTSGGAVKMFVNGSLLGTPGSVGSVDYGGTLNADFTVGNRGTASEGRVGDQFSDSFMIADALPDAAIAAMAAAAGFA